MGHDDDHDDDIVFHTYVGRARTELSLTRAEFDRWVANIRADIPLRDAILRILRGEDPLHDLDEGEAGIFPARIFPHTERVAERLDWRDPGARAVVVAFLLPRVLETVADQEAAEGNS